MWLVWLMMFVPVVKVVVHALEECEIVAVWVLAVVFGVVVVVFVAAGQAVDVLSLGFGCCIGFVVGEAAGNAVVQDAVVGSVVFASGVVGMAGY